jgi:hypothetical protein
MEGSCWSEAFFITLDGPQTHDDSDPSTQRSGEIAVLS